MLNRIAAPGKPRRIQRQAGFTLIEIMIVVMIIGVLLNIATPSLISARDRGQARACVKNLTDFQTAKEQYAMDNKIPASSTTAITWTNISPYIRAAGGTPVTGPTCPTNGAAYNYQNLSTAPTCTYGGPVGNLHQVF